MGTLSFGTIHQLPASWWTSQPPNDPQDVWTVWDRNTYYLWGANAGNYQGIPIGQSLQGDGMAGAHGPTLGRAHPHYVGVITMSAPDLPKNDAVFQQLAQFMASGKTVLLPTFHGAWSLGAGIGKGVADWGEIQLYLLKQVLTLGKTASSVSIPAGTYWADWRPGCDGAEYPIASLADVQAIADMLDQTRPVPKAVTVAGRNYTLVAFYYPDKLTDADRHYHAGCFGNFYPSPLTLDVPDPNTGQPIVPTPRFHLAEAAFQALKWWGDATIRQKFESFTTGDQAYHYKLKLPHGDPTYAGLGRDGAMQRVVKEKFTNNDTLKTALLATKDAYLIEHATHSQDDYWSDGGPTKIGDNMLGRTLMELRGTLPGGQPAPPGTDNNQMVAPFKQAV